MKSWCVASTLFLLCLYFIVSSYGEDVKSIIKSRSISCPNNCSNQGSCFNGSCSCNIGYSGIDCSIFVRSLNPVNGSILYLTVDSRSWNYFNTSLTQGQGLTYHLNSFSGDCDLYVQIGSLPTRTYYAQRDLSPYSNITFAITNPTAGNWFLGVYGFTKCQYSIYATVNSPCNASCNNHGSCLANNTCACYAGWTGPTCASPLQYLNTSTPITNYIDYGIWNFYVYNVTANTTYLQFQLTKLNATTNGYCKLDMYIKSGQLPSVTSYNYSHYDISSAHNYSIGISSPRTGVLYVGISSTLSYSRCAYTINAITTANSGCPSRCSSHGTCQSNTCHCNFGFSGAYCETMNNALIDGEVVSGYVNYDMWNYYHYTATTTRNVVIWVNQTYSGPNVSQDCDVYVKQGSNPTKTSYTYDVIDYSNTSKIVVVNPGFQTWYIGVYGFQHCNYTVSATAESLCVAGCTYPYGNCSVAGVCVCNPGYAGENCHNQVFVVNGTGNAIRSTILTNVWIYYEVTVNRNSSYLSVNLLETNSTGQIWLFVNQQSFPTLQQSDYSNKETNTNLHSITVMNSLPVGQLSAIYYVGVYGSPFEINNKADPFSISIWASPF